MSVAPAARTRGFLFADLRGYTEFVETHGDHAAARLLTGYRELVRTAVAASDGAEIRTEGDSFYVVFPSAGPAVSCGLAIVEAAAAASAAHPDRPVRVGVGVHAGETVETAEGFVGSAVNIAARVCAQARAGEVLVTDTVRSLTRTSLDVRFEPRGTPRLKGVAEPIALYAVSTGAAYPASTSAPARNPYKGLRPFGEDDRADFFGRDALAARLLERLGQVARAGRLLTVVGPSGSGKSSVVRAGLIPAVRSGALGGSERWSIALMFPGARPFEELAAALRSVAPRPHPGLGADLDEHGDIGAAVATVLPSEDDRLLLVIDQLEELFTVVRDELVRGRFLAALARALSADRGRLVVVATLRADFLDRPLLSPDLGPLVRDGLEAVTPLSRDELEAAITRPAAAVGLELEPGLAAEVITEVARQPGALPQLQYALTELYERSDGHRLTRATYAAIGGVLGALGKRAEETHGALDAESRELARQVLLRLVVAHEGAEPTGQRVPTSELGSLVDDPARVAGVLEAFGRWRLLSFDRDATSGEPTVEIAHEALLSRWPRLAGWIEEEREDLWMRRRLDDAAVEWSRAGRDPSFLLGGSRLELFDGWASITDLRLDPLERSYLDASLAERDRRDAEERARAEHERSLERRAAGRLRALVVVFAAAALLAAGLLAVVLGQAETARQQEQAAREAEAIATARELAAASVGNLGTDPVLSLLLGVEAARATADRGWITEEAMDALHWALQTANVAYPLRDGPVATRPGPEGSRGVYVLAPGELVDLALAHADRSLTVQECRTYLHSDACPPDGGSRDVAPDLEVRTAAGPVPAGSLASGSLAGTRVSILSDLPADLDLDPILSSFEDASGIGVSTATLGDTDLAALPAGDLPDLAIVSRPRDIAALAEAGRLIDLGGFLDAAEVGADPGESLLSLGTVGPDGDWPSPSGRLVGVPITTSLGGLVWYPTAAFEAAGYQEPETWDGLLELSRQIVAAGGTPWCLGVEAGPDSGSAAADWVEQLVLKGSGPPVHQDWAVGGLGKDSGASVAMDDVRIILALRAFGEIALGDGFVLGGPGSIPLIPERLAPWPLGQAPATPSCWLWLGTGRDRADWPAALSGAVDWFPLPAADELHAGALSGTTSSIVVFHDRPEVRELARSLVGEDFAAALARTPGAVGMLPVRRVDRSLLRDEVDGRQSDLLRTALDEGSFRADASGLMPPGMARSFSNAMLSYLAGAAEGDVLGRLHPGGSTAAPAASDGLRASVTYDGQECSYEGPLVVPAGSSMTVDFAITRSDGLGRLIFAPVGAGTSWDSVLAAEARPAAPAPDWRSLPLAWPSLPILVGPIGSGQTQTLAGPGSDTVVLDTNLAEGTRYDSFLVACTATDVTRPDAATLIRVVDDEGAAD